MIGISSRLIKQSEIQFTFASKEEMMSELLERLDKDCNEWIEYYAISQQLQMSKREFEEFINKITEKSTNISLTDYDDLIFTRYANYILDNHGIILDKRLSQSWKAIIKLSKENSPRGETMKEALDNIITVFTQLYKISEHIKDLGGIFDKNNYTIYLPVRTTVKKEKPNNSDYGICFYKDHGEWKVKTSSGLYENLIC